MTLFPDEEATELLEIENPEGITGVINKAGREKSAEPRHRTKRLRGWPGEAALMEIYREGYIQEKGRPPTKADMEQWRQEKGETLWEEATEGLAEGEAERIIRENAICHVAKVVANTIHLEEMYTTLKPIGTKQWELASKGLRSLTDTENLMALADTKQEKIPQWVKGAIIYLSLLGSRAGAPKLQANDEKVPDMNALKHAAQWCLGGHLRVGGVEQTLEETTSLFEKYGKLRKKMDLELTALKATEIPIEMEVKPPKTLEGAEIPWNLGWRLLPITEKEIRELADKVLTAESAIWTLGLGFKRKLLNRWTSAGTRRAYLRHWAEKKELADRWVEKTLVLAPVDKYISNKMPAGTPLRMIAKTESAWVLATEDLPEPESW
jgi:hypothetical protein